MYYIYNYLVSSAVKHRIRLPLHVIIVVFVHFIYIIFIIIDYNRLMQISINYTLFICIELFKYLL